MRAAFMVSRSRTDSVSQMTDLSPRPIRTPRLVLLPLQRADAAQRLVAGDATGAIEIGYGLAELYRRQGYGTELVRALSQWLLDRTPVRAVTAAVGVENIASIRVLERAGFPRGRADGEHLWYTLSGSNTPAPREESRE